LKFQDFERCRDIYKAALGVVPNKQFTFSKLWLQFAYFEIRRLNLQAARKILGASIGMCPKESLFKKYIQLEIDVGISLPYSDKEKLTPGCTASRIR
jgi:crooked neck